MFLKIAVVGCGRQGQDAVKDLLDEKTSPGAQKVLVTDINEEKVRAFAKEVGDTRLTSM
jgi:predicted dehydrogenase